MSKYRIKKCIQLNSDGCYFWLDSLSPRITEIRIEMGLVPYLANNCYHISVGNIKHLIKDKV